MRFAESSWGTVSAYAVTSIAKSQMTDQSHHVVWYFFSDVYPPLHDGHRPLDPPAWWTRLFEGRPAPVESEPTPVNNDFAAAGAPEVR